MAYQHEKLVVELEEKVLDAFVFFKKVHELGRPGAFLDRHFQHFHWRTYQKILIKVIQ